MTEEQQLKPLSTRAQKLLKRLHDGAWYPAFGNVPKAMSELQAHGLVGVCGRPQTIVACFVPASGFTPWVNERFERVA